MSDHCFISYSTADALEFARKLADKLEGGEDKFIDAWLDKRDIDPARDWDDQLVEGIKTCKCMAFVMSKDSTAPGTMCKNEWTWALKYKKPVIPIRYHKDAEQPFGLGNRQWIDFTGNFEHGLAKMRMFLREMDSPKGILQSYKDRLADAERALRRAKDDEAQRIQVEIEDLKKQIETQQKIVDDPEGAKAQTQKNIEAGLERERKPEKPTAAQTSTKFINPPPGIAPTYFQDRFIETQQAVDFLKDDAQRLMTIVGRGGVGKTAMVCRLLKGLETSEFPDGLGMMKVEGIVYLSESGSHRATFANIFYDLCKLLPNQAAQELDAVYKNPQASTESKMHALLENFSGGRVVLLLDNFEPIVDSATQKIRENELDEALRALVCGPHHMVNALITTRIAPRDLNLCEPGRQRVLTLNEGLESPYAENILREMDSDGRMGLKSAPEDLLRRARERTRGYPRALEALFAILASDRYTTLEELLAMPTPENVVEVLVGEAFNRLDVNAQKVMQALAIYNRPVTPAAVDYLLAPHLPAVDSAPILQRLANMHFARKESGRFYLHPVDREFAFGLIPAGEGQGVKEFNQHDLTLRAADYFAQARKPRAEWKKLNDLAAQLAEFDLRCAAGDYDTASSVLCEFDFDYLLLWGHYRLMIEMHEKLQGKINDKTLARVNAGNLGTAYAQIGQVKIAIRHHEKVLELAREDKNKQHEGAALGNLGSAFVDLGDARKAIEFYEQALGIAREIGYQKGEGANLNNLGNLYKDLGDVNKAIEVYEKSLEIKSRIGDQKGEANSLVNLGLSFLDMGNYQKSEENLLLSIDVANKISYSVVQLEARGGLAQAYLFQNDLVNARATIEAALQYDVPQYNHNASTLHGIIALRQGDASDAYQAFTRAIAQADEILAKTPEYYEALDAKGLAFCGLALTTGDSHLRVDCCLQAIETFRAARKIAPHAGVIKAVLLLFDELAKCDTEGILKDVRKAVEGS